MWPFDTLREARIRSAEDCRLFGVEIGQLVVNLAQGRYLTFPDRIASGRLAIDAANTAGYLRIATLAGRHPLPDYIDPASAVTALTTAQGHLINNIGAGLPDELHRNDIWQRTGIRPGDPAKTVDEVFAPLIAYYSGRQ